LDNNLLKRKVTSEGQEKIRLAGYKQWLNRANEVHGDSFSYIHSYDSFKTQKKPEVQITCLKHSNEFHVSPFNHIRFKSGGCKQCDEEQASKYFLNRELKKFESFFLENLSHRLEMHSPFQGMTLDMKFLCKKHESVESHKPTFLMNNSGYGCKQCANEKRTEINRLRIEDVKEEFKDLLPDNITILSVEFDEVERSSRIKSNCDIHGENITTKGYLKRSEHKCPNCGNESIGYAGHRLRSLLASGTKGRATYIGVMSIEVFGIESLKVGVTTRTLAERYKWNLKKIYFSAQLTEIDAYVLENQIHRKFKKQHDLRILMAGMRNGERWSGDTECYWHDRLDEIIEFVKSYLNDTSSIDYKKELSVFEVPNFFPRDVSRNKDETNKPLKVIGVDPDSLEVVVEFDSISDATRAGYTNVSQIISGKSERQIANGLRWFKKDSFDKNQISPLRMSLRGSPKEVICIETGEEFASISIAETTLRNRGIKVSGSHITSVCKGRRKIASGFTWKYKLEI
jgi:predicted RNA-binding Zn-ribbon protein involved in translation (DUF1610 family)